MIRLIGILIGSAAAVGLLIVMLGIPEFSAQDAKTGERGQPAIEPVIAATPLPEPDEPEVPAEAAVADEAPVAEAPVPVVTDEQLVEQIFAPQPEPVLDEHWYAFWSPFRSEIAANGFIARLQQTTGMDYRVVKLKPGVYEVAFAYTDQDDVEQKLARISAATGLDMSGG
ncbi:MAG: hypothetical protein QNJ11_09495 [Woeseiaceae bacterium]|nr:hypothetical protein [Woeseiaceae bacterium]